VTEPPRTLEVIAPQHTKDAPTLTLVPDQGRKILERINVRDPKIGTRPDKRTRRGRGKRRGKVTTQDGTENVPPPATQQNTLSRRRRTRGSGYVDIGTRPAPRRGRTASNVGGVETANVVNYVTSQAAETNDDVKTTGRHTHVDRAQSRVDAGMRPKHRARGRLPSHGKQSGPGLGFEDMGIPNMVKDSDVNTADQLTSGENRRRSGATASSPCREMIPEPTTECDVSTLQPLPSSTRRRAKEYFQRRTRERSVDAVGRQARPSRRCVTMAELGIRSSVQVSESQLDVNGGAIVNASAKAHGRSGSVSDVRRDQFVFDPEASPFTPTATSSPRQASLSSIAFSSPTPLPSHGNRKVVPLILPDTSNRSSSMETKRDSVPQLIPITSNGITRGLAYTYAAPNQSQAHLQTEQMALMRLQAYYNWLAGSLPAAGVGIGIQGCEHMDMSGGGGGLSGGVALGRHAQIQGRGKGQCRNASGAYAHPKEHVVFSPRDHEHTEIGSQSALQQDSVQIGIVQTGKGESEKEPEGEAQKGHKWDGKWGLRDVAAPGREIGWSWGRKGTGDVKLGPLGSLGE
jgi:hypothetical protein